MYKRQVADMDVAALLVADGGFAAMLAPARRIVVADEHAGGIGQGIQALDGVCLLYTSRCV